MKTWYGLTVCLSMALLAACATTPEELESDRPVAALDQHLLDGVFVAPGADFSRYTRLLVTDLNLDEWRPEGSDLPLQAMNRNDRQFFREEYVGALVHFLVSDGSFQLSMEVGPEVLLVDASLHQSTLGSEHGQGSRALDPRDMAVIVLKLELYDSVSGRMLATIIDRQPLGRAASQSASPLTAAQMRRAFSHWLLMLREELNTLQQR